MKRYFGTLKPFNIVCKDYPNKVYDKDTIEPKPLGIVKASYNRLYEDSPVEVEPLLNGDYYQLEEGYIIPKYFFQRIEEIEE
jgi:hypothetical protein